MVEDEVRMMDLMLRAFLSRLAGVLVELTRSIELESLI